MEFCQSCGMPLVNESEISDNKEYCIYCYENGQFKADITVEQMIEACVSHLMNAHKELSEEEARENLKKFLPTLKRWK
ncbi:zinc ribbon domain-containing protein [Clostridium ihumii]|uniref:zinc ribbon domain-containing protein n=1 Tax=Clostridium ihumii TaxID=1470356 RepID=UPI00058E9496|nr:zinc ribbon domain-containing protein [Clostridium ihumii]